MKYEFDIADLRSYFYKQLERKVGKAFAEALYDFVYCDIEDFIVDCEVTNNDD